MAKGILNVTLPAAGMNRAAGFQSQPPYTTPYAMNVRAYENTPGRARICTRPGSGRYLIERAGTGIVNMMAVVSSAVSTTQSAIEDDCSGVWDFPASGFFNADTPLEDDDAIVDPLNQYYYTDDTSKLVGCFLSDVDQDDDTDPGNETSSMLTVVPYNGEHAGEYHVYILVRASDVNPSEYGVDVAMTLTTVSGTDRLTIVATQYDNSTPTVLTPSVSTSSLNLGYHDTRTFRIFFNPDTNAMTVTWGPTTATDPPSYTAASYTVSALAHTDQRMTGWAMKPSSSGKRAIVSNFRFTYAAQTATTKDINKLTLISDGDLYYENPYADVDQATGYTFNGSVPLQTAQRLGVLYIADYGDVIYDGAMTVVTFGAGPNYQANVYVPAPYFNLTAAGANTADYIVEIYEWVSGAGWSDWLPAGVYSFSTINNVSAGTNNGVLTTRTTTVVAPVGSGQVNARIRRSPKKFTLSSNSVSKVENGIGLAIENVQYGTIPVGCPLVCEYRDRLVWAGNPSYVWYMSRNGDPGDYNYGVDPDDPAQAISGTISEAGNMPLTITALVPLGDQNLLFGTADRIFRMNGDPAFGGSLFPVGNDPVGIIGANAWCLSPDGWLYFLARQGLFRVPASFAGPVEPISRERLPNELLNVDPNRFHVRMIYDVEGDGVIIFVSLLGTVGGTATHWWFDVRNGGLWPFTLPNSYDPLGACRERGYFRASQRILFGGRDGYIRTFSSRFRTDDWATLSSYVTLGPLRTSARIDMDGGLDEVAATLGNQSENLTLGVYGAGYPEAALRAAIFGTANFTHTLTDGLNVGIFPRVRGNAVIAKLSGTGKWQLDEIQMTASELGKTRPG